MDRYDSISPAIASPAFMMVPRPQCVSPSRSQDDTVALPEQVPGKQESAASRAKTYGLAEFENPLLVPGQKVVRMWCGCGAA